MHNFNYSCFVTYCKLNTDLFCEFCDLGYPSDFMYGLSHFYCILSYSVLLLDWSVRLLVIYVWHCHYYHYSCTYLYSTCMLMSKEAVALNAHILLPKLVKSVLDSVGRRCFGDMLRKSIPVRHDFLAEEHSTNTTCISCLRQLQTVPSEVK